eukprot:gene15192-biopygen4947
MRCEDGARSAMIGAGEQRARRRRLHDAAPSLPRAGGRWAWAASLFRLSGAAAGRRAALPGKLNPVPGLTIRAIRDLEPGRGGPGWSRLAFRQHQGKPTGMSRCQCLMKRPVLHCGCSGTGCPDKLPKGINSIPQCLFQRGMGTKGEAGHGRVAAQELVAGSRPHRLQATQACANRPGP